MKRYTVIDFLKWLSALASFALWVGGISWLTFICFDLTPTIAWLIFSTLSALSALSMGVLLYEIRHAYQVADDFEPNGSSPYVSKPRLPVYPRLSKLSTVQASGTYRTTKRF